MVYLCTPLPHPNVILHHFPPGCANSTSPATLWRCLCGTVCQLARAGEALIVSRAYYSSCKLFFFKKIFSTTFGKCKSTLRWRRREISNVRDVVTLLQSHSLCSSHHWRLKKCLRNRQKKLISRPLNSLQPKNPQELVEEKKTSRTPHEVDRDLHPVHIDCVDGGRWQTVERRQRKPRASKEFGVMRDLFQLKPVTIMRINN